jgi:hypothetical protein
MLVATVFGFRAIETRKRGKVLRDASKGSAY